MTPPYTPENEKVQYLLLYMGNIQSLHELLHVYSVILLLLFVSRTLAFNFMLMSVKCSVQISVFVVYKSAVSNVKEAAM